MKNWEWKKVQIMVPLDHPRLGWVAGKCGIVRNVTFPSGDGGSAQLEVAIPTDAGEVVVYAAEDLVIEIVEKPVDIWG